MRVVGQLAAIAVLGAAGFGGWYAYKEGHLAKAPAIGSYFAQPAQPRRGPWRAVPADRAAHPWSRSTR